MDARQHEWLEKHHDAEHLIFDDQANTVVAAVYLSPNGYHELQKRAFIAMLKASLTSDMVATRASEPELDVFH